MLRRYVTGGRTDLYIILDRHATIKHSMARELPESIGYHHYYSRHLVSNFNTRFKNIVLKNMLHKMCDESSKQDFDILYEDLIELDDEIKEWL